ncbi:MAG: flagellar hook basal-body protein [Sedimentisphaerales bacterium]|jgi:flagellar basal-body rod protein FlgF
MPDIAAQIGSTVEGLSREFDIIANNLANVSTVGYKRRCNTFSKLLTAQETGTKTETGSEADLHSAFDFSQGNFIETGRTLDFALCGNGFFVVETPNGPLYTRNGMFSLNQNGQIVDSAGRTVAGESGPISIPSNIGLSQISVSSDGSVSAAGTVIGKLKLVDFKNNESKLIAAGLNCFQAPNNISPETPKNLIVKQGYQEGSNVQMVEELVDMIMVSRLYEANMKFMAVGSDAAKSLINVAMA